MLNSATTGEIEQLTEEQKASFRHGLQSHLGEQGFDEFFDEMYRRELAASGVTPPSPGYRASVHGDVYKSRDIDVAGERWAACKERFCEIVARCVEAEHGGYPGVDTWMARLTLTWADDDSVGDIESTTRAYDALDPPPIGSGHGVCLFVTPASLDSILDVPVPLTADGKLLMRRYRTEIPYVVALSGNGSEEEEDWRGYFNVAVESLVTSLFPAIADDSLTPWELGGYITGEDVWCEIGRYGIHKAGVGYWDKRTQRRPE